MADFKSDEELIALCKKDVRHFKALYEKYSSRLFSYCAARLNYDQDKAFDIVSETFTKAIENIDKYTYVGKPYIAYLYTISHNLIVDSYKSNNIFSLDELEIEPTEEEENIVDKLSYFELKNQLKIVISELSEDLKELIILKNEQELSFKEIAVILNENEGAIKMRYYRTIDLLKKNLTKKGALNGHIKQNILKSLLI